MRALLIRGMDLSVKYSLSLYLKGSVHFLNQQYHSEWYIIQQSDIADDMKTKLVTDSCITNSISINFI